MIRQSLALLVFAMPLAAQAADDSRVSFLEQEVRNLQRTVSALTRRVDQLDSRPASPVARASRPAAGRAASQSDAWVDAAKWRKIRAGMSELEVVALLGPPTSMREDAGARVLLYALEISGGFLGGSVKFRERAVSEVQAPVLQ